MTVDARTRAATETATGVEGNARLTSSVAAVLFVLLFVEGVTIVQLRQLMPVHVFVGLLLIPPVLLKIGSTTYRFARYYAGSPEYRRKGPPPLLLRGSGPLVVLTTLAVLGTGVGLLFVAPGSGWAGTLIGLHKASFVLWFLLMALHVLGHLGETVRLAARDVRRASPGRRLRQAVVAVSLAVGVAAGAMAIPAIPTWSHWMASHHQRDG